MTDGVVERSSGGWTLHRGRVSAFALFLFVDVILVAVMLVTDKNLQTNFGAQAPYYYHWYGLLAEGILDLIVAGALVASISRSAQVRSFSSRKRVVLAGLAWTVLAILAMLGIVATYQQVGFASASEFAKYLFGVTVYPSLPSYIPWLYDLLLAMYIVTALVGAWATRAVPMNSEPTA
jgi:hypothetical protein